ncbi:amino acid ABC transporter permease [Sphingomonas pseudosanguinis]|uniref:General L-amino acid transport system permease protein n=1 Tax=Sphingomonas pseudosanguinis TaxID=413712 RepID=A0A7W6F4W6_9SPHN|nr:ABC transporter permease subunit [Sphingomonas pseudosanguinis]MBB3880905.1 general L-amino acid transport system permease protein [Sphingomonas pseudosanguinis]MBN3535805.1 ABC transporter permease subunit [Sphingomonas pseudosanguinis]
MARGGARWRWWLPQIGLLAMVVAGLAWLAANVADNLARRGIATGLSFLDRAARFPISESILPYSPVDSFAWAIIVGLGNTLFLSVLVAAISTLLGLPIALARRSDHALAKALGGGFVDLIRNTPLVVQLLFWYGAVTIGLPPSAEAWQPMAGIFFTDRGLYLTTFGLVGSALPMLLAVAAGLVATAILAWRGKLRQASITTLATVMISVVMACALGLQRDTPVLGRFNFSGGLTLTPEFVAVLLGLVLYASAFAAEIIRGGIDAVAKGQWEAGRAIGLSERQTLRLIVMPQALRIMMPPMTSQFVNILKNSTLALVVGYPELNFVTATTINQTGQALEGIAILMIAFLMLSGLISLLMNRLNARIALVER